MKSFVLFLSLILFSYATIAQDKQRCTATTVKKMRCKNQATKGNFCSIHDPARPKCGATTSKGTPCKNPVSKTGEQCWRHKEK